MSAEKYNDVIVKVVVRVWTAKNAILLAISYGLNVQTHVNLASITRLMKILIVTHVLTVNIKTNMVRQIVKRAAPDCIPPMAMHVLHVLVVNIKTLVEGHAKTVLLVNIKTKIVKAHAKTVLLVNIKIKMVKKHAYRVPRAHTKTNMVKARAKTVLLVNIKT